jgi:hypothetical protein
MWCLDVPVLARRQISANGADASRTGARHSRIHSERLQYRSAHSNAVCAWSGPGSVARCGRSCQLDSGQNETGVCLTDQWYVVHSQTCCRLLTKLFAQILTGHSAAIVSGDPVSLHALRVALAQIQAPGNDAQSQARIPFSQRKPVFSASYLPVSVPFHTPLLTGAVDLILNDCKRLGMI